MWNSSNLIFFFALIFFLIQPSQEESEKTPTFRLTEKQIQLAWEKQNSYLYLCQEKKIN